ncbi:MAG: hypothetical protein RL227_1761 [Pseudomonadota bacterium]
MTLRVALHVALRSAAAAGLLLLPPAALALDLLQAWQGAQQQAPEAAVAAAARDAGAARASQAQALWRPTLGLEAGVSYASADTATRGALFAAPGFGRSTGVSFDSSVTGGTSTRYALALRQPIYGRERSASARTLEIAAEAAALEWAQAQQALMLRSTEAYFNVVLAAERLRLLGQQQQAVEEAAVEAADRFRLGDRPVTEVHEAQARAAALEAERLVAQTQWHLSREALADLTGLQVQAAALWLPQEVRVNDVPALQECLARAERGNPALRLADAQWRRAQAQARASASAWSPTVDVVARLSHERLAGDGDFGRARQSGRQAAIGLVLSVPLYTGGLRDAQHAEGRALAEQAGAEWLRVRLQVAQQVHAAWLALSIGGRRTGALLAALQAGRVRLDATRTGQQAGDRTLLDVLNAENDAAAAEFAVLEARVRQLSERLRLAALAGELDEVLLAQVNGQLRPPDGRGP